MEIKKFTTDQNQEFRYFEDNDTKWIACADIRRHLCSSIDYLMCKHGLDRHAQLVDNPDIPNNQLRFVNVAGLCEAGQHNKKIKQFCNDYLLSYMNKDNEVVINNDNITESNLKIFQNEAFGSVNTIMIDGEPWLSGKDVTQILGYENQNRDIQRHVDEEDRQMIPLKTQYQNGIESSKGQRGSWFINESGFYSLVLRSKLPSAKKFKHWVTSEVLPSLRKNGGYIVGQEQLTDTELLAKSVLVAQQVIAEREKRIEALQIENNNQQKQIKTMKPKSDYYDKILQTTNAVCVSVIAKDYGMTAISLNSWLHENGIQYKVGDTWLLYKEYADKGYTDTATYTYRDPKNGTDYSTVYTKWTQKGRKFIYDVMASKGIVPVMERARLKS